MTYFQNNKALGYHNGYIAKEAQRGRRANELRKKERRLAYQKRYRAGEVGLFGQRKDTPSPAAPPQNTPDILPPDRHVEPTMGVPMRDSRKQPTLGDRHLPTAPGRRQPGAPADVVSPEATPTVSNPRIGGQMGVHTLVDPRKLSRRWTTNRPGESPANEKYRGAQYYDPKTNTWMSPLPTEDQYPGYQRPEGKSTSRSRPGMPASSAEKALQAKYRENIAERASTGSTAMKKDMSSIANELYYRRWNRGKLKPSPPSSSSPPKMTPGARQSTGSIDNSSRGWATDMTGLKNLMRRRHFDRPKLFDSTP